MRLVPWLGRVSGSSLPPSLLSIVAVGIGIRLLLVPWFSNPFNFWGIHLATDLLLEGNDPFLAFAADPRFSQVRPWSYPAPYFIFTSFAVGASLGDGYLYGIWLRIPSIAFDAGTAVLSYHIARLMGARQSIALSAAAAFSLNPFSIFLTSISGTNDALPVFFSLLSVFFLLKGRQKDQNLAAWSLGLGIALKLYPLLLLPIALAMVTRWRERLRFIALVSIVPLITSIPNLVSGGVAYLQVLISFSAGLGERRPVNPQFTPLQAIASYIGPVSPIVIVLSALALVTGLYLLYRLVRFGKVTPVAGSSLALIFAYLIGVRWAPSYIIWIVPFTNVLALVLLAGWKRLIVLSFWAPALAFTLIYSGWYEDFITGASGLFYFALISGAPISRAFEGLPPSFSTFLLIGFIGLATTVFVVTLGARRGSDHPRIVPTTARPSLAGELSNVPNSHLILAASLAVILIGVSVGSVIYQVSNRKPVTPLDFATLNLDTTGNVRLDDDFHATILSFRWVFVGPGRYSLHPNGTSGIVLDTLDGSGRAFLRNDVDTTFLSVLLTFRIVALYGAQPLILLRGPGGWLGAVSDSEAGPATLIYFDETIDRSFPLIEVPESWTQVSLAFSPQERRITAMCAELVLPGTGSPVGAVRIGHTDFFSNGGGAIWVSEVVMEWLSDSDVRRDFLAVAILGGGAMAFGILGLLYRLSRWKRKTGHGQT